MKLSILIPTLPSRFAFFARLWAILEPQLTDEVEVIWLGDTKNRSVGAKRNALLALSSAKYTCFIDDDDVPHKTEYVSQILKATESDADVLVFDQIVRLNNGPPRLCRYGLELEYTDEPGEPWTGLPAHTQAYKTSIAKQGIFPDKSYSEDSDWVAQVAPLCKTQHRIESEPLYEYWFNAATTETRKRRRKPV